MALAWFILAVFAVAGFRPVVADIDRLPFANNEAGTAQARAPQHDAPVAEVRVAGVAFEEEEDGDDSPDVVGMTARSPRAIANVRRLAVRDQIEGVDRAQSLATRVARGPPLA